VIDPAVIAAVPAKPKSKRKPYVPTGRPPGRPKGSRTKLAGLDIDPPPIKPAAMRYPVASFYSGFSVSYLKKLVASGELESILRGNVRLILTRSLDRLLGLGA
jgi:hypothetical protein